MSTKAPKASAFGALSPSGLPASGGQAPAGPAAHKPEQGPHGARKGGDAFDPVIPPDHRRQRSDVPGPGRAGSSPAAQAGLCAADGHGYHSGDSGRPAAAAVFRCRRHTDPGDHRGVGILGLGTALAPRRRAHYLQPCAGDLAGSLRHRDGRHQLLPGLSEHH